MTTFRTIKICVLSIQLFAFVIQNLNGLKLFYFFLSTIRKPTVVCFQWYQFDFTFFSIKNAIYILYFNLFRNYFQMFVISLRVKSYSEFQSNFSRIKQFSRKLDSKNIQNRKEFREKSDYKYSKAIDFLSYFWLNSANCFYIMDILKFIVLFICILINFIYLFFLKNISSPMNEVYLLMAVSFYFTASVFVRRFDQMWFFFFSMYNRMLISIITCFSPLFSIPPFSLYYLFNEVTMVILLNIYYFCSLCLNFLFYSDQNWFSITKFNSEVL